MTALLIDDISYWLSFNNSYISSYKDYKWLLSHQHINSEKDKGFCVKQSEWDEEKAFKPSLELDFGVCSFCQLTSRIAINMNFPLLEGGWNSKNGFGEIYRGALLFLFFFHLFPPWLQTLPVINKMSLGNGWTGGDISRRRFGGHPPPRWIRCFLQRKKWPIKADLLSYVLFY